MTIRRDKALELGLEILDEMKRARNGACEWCDGALESSGECNNCEKGAIDETTS